jgi:hypothetical protein
MKQRVMDFEGKNDVKAAIQSKALVNRKGSFDGGLWEMLKKPG